MDIRNRKELKTFAVHRLEQAQQEKRIVLIYAGLVLGASLLVTLVNYLLGLQISQTGGLGNMGIRSFLSAMQTVLPILKSVVVMCLGLGFTAAMLRIARGQYASPRTLQLGFGRFWPLLRLSILKGLIYFGIAFGSVYAATILYLLTPLSDSAMEILTPLVSETSIMNPGIVLDDATYAQLTSAMMPVIVIFCLIYCAVLAPILYQFRMADYVLIDRPAIGALRALQESRKMMRGNRMNLFRLDLSLWWYYASVLGTTVVCYGDMILPSLGITFPWSDTVSYFLFFLLSLALQLAIYYFLCNRVSVTYALAYDAVKPEEKKDNGVVLGNIFNM